MKTTVVAIDPGQNGGIAWAEIDGAFCKPMPETIKDLDDLLFDIEPVTCIVENVGGYMPGNSGPAAVKFARHVGQIEGLLVGCGFPFERVAPQTWMKALGTVPKDKAERKRWIKARMQEQYPHCDVTLKTADALGILTWAMKNAK